MKHDSLYLNIASLIAQQSHCKRSKVGAVIVKDGNIVSFGWNGQPPGIPNECECDDETLPTVIHAEANAIAKAAGATDSTKGGTIYLTHSPCFECSKLIIQSGIKRVVYIEQYRDTRPVALLTSLGISMEHSNEY